MCENVVFYFFDIYKKKFSRSQKKFFCLPSSRDQHNEYNNIEEKFLGLKKFSRLWEKNKIFFIFIFHPKLYFSFEAQMVGNF